MLDKLRGLTDSEDFTESEFSEIRKLINENKDSLIRSNESLKSKILTELESLNKNKTK